ncbi:carboxyl-terminal protease [Pseudoalteromonas sp. S16_S37]|nr:carboxyl-terminal protease [Pseudoalteromonas sp. S16_S37]
MVFGGFFALSLCACQHVTIQNVAQSFNANLAWLELKNTLEQQYAYLDRSGVDKDKLFNLFAPKLLATQSKQAFADTAQQLLRNFYDPHLNLGPYNEQDFSVYPTGSDIYVNYQNQQFIVVDVKAGSAADLAGIRANMLVTKVNGLSMSLAVKQVLGRELSQLLPEQVNYAANVSLGGLRNTVRTITVNNGMGEKYYELAASYEAINALRDGPMVSYRKIDNLGYVRFNNGLGNAKTVDEFKQALLELIDTEALIIDLRNTPSGGNTSVAEPILGHFVTHKTAYQRYQTQLSDLPYIDVEMSTAYVEPNLPFYDKPFVVLAGHWSGSMGEGMTIGFDAIGAKAVIGAPMADLLGGIKTVQLKHSDTWLELGFERLYHVNGSFREDFVPHIRLDTADRDSAGNDPALAKALSVLDKV